MARVLILLVAVAASVVLLFGVTRLNAETHTQSLRRPQTGPNQRGGPPIADPDATGTVVAPDHIAQTPDANVAPRPTSPVTGSEAIRPTLVAPPDQPTYTVEDVIEYLHESGVLEGVRTGPAGTIEDITFMTADEATIRVNTGFSRSGTFPVCVVTLHGDFVIRLPYGSGPGTVTMQRMVFDGITGNLLLISSR